MIDLTLAVNYLPAAVCLLRLVWYLFIMTLLRPGEEIGGYLIIGLVLYLDRVVFRVYVMSVIFDTSAVILAVFFANVYHLVRASNTWTHMNFLGIVVNVWWVACCVCMILEPPRLRRVFEKRNRFYHILPAMIMVAALVAQVQVHSEREEAGTKFARGIVFGLLSLVWIYVVGIHQSQALEPLKDNSSHFISRFAPVLYLPAPVALLFSVVASGCVGYQYAKLCERAPAEQQDVESPPAVAESAQEEIREENLEAMFRLARASRN